jgi:hypothetical protein
MIENADRQRIMAAKVRREKVLAAKTQPQIERISRRRRNAPERISRRRMNIEEQ